MSQIYWFLLVSFLFETASHASRPLVALQMAALGSSPGEIGFLFGAASLLPLALSIPMGQLSDRVGPLRVITIGTVAGVLSAVGMALIPYSPAVAAAYGVMWLGVSSVMVGQQVVIAALGDPADRDRNYGWLGAANAAGQLVGPGLGGTLADLFGLRQVFLVSAAVGALPLLVIFYLARTPVARQLKPVSAGHRAGFAGFHLWRRPELRLIFLVAAFATLALDVRNSFLSVYMHSLGFPKATIGLLFSLMAAAGILVRTAAGWLTRHLGNWRLLAAATGLAVPALFLLPLATQVAAVAPAVAALGISFGLTQILTMSITVGAAAPAERGLALGVRMSGQMMSMLVSPMLLGALAATLGLGAVFVGAGACILVASATAVRGARLAATAARVSATL